MSWKRVKLKISWGKKLAACHIFCRDYNSLIPSETAARNNDLVMEFAAVI